MAGLGVKAGAISSENLNAFDLRAPDEDLSVRHAKRGQLSMVGDGKDANGSEFMITFGEA